MARIKAYWGSNKTPTIWTIKTKERAKAFAKGIKKTGWKRITFPKG